MIYSNLYLRPLQINNVNEHGCFRLCSSYNDNYGNKYFHFIVSSLFSKCNRVCFTTYCGIACIHNKLIETQ